MNNKSGTIVILRNENMLSSWDGELYDHIQDAVYDAYDKYGWEADYYFGQLEDGVLVYIYTTPAEEFTQDELDTVAKELGLK